MGKCPFALHASAQLALARLTTLAGNWQGQAAMAPQPGMSAPALMHEMVPEASSDDPRSGDDDPIAMLYIDGDRLILTHDCDSGKNRPRTVGKSSPAGKTVEFDFLDVSGGTGTDICIRQQFTVIDARHHPEDWTHRSSANKPGHAHIDLVRAR